MQLLVNHNEFETLLDFELSYLAPEFLVKEVRDGYLYDLTDTQIRSFVLDLVEILELNCANDVTLHHLLSKMIIRLISKYI